MAFGGGNGNDDGSHLELRKHLLAGVTILVVGGAMGYAVTKEEFSLPRGAWCHAWENARPQVPAHARHAVIVTSDNGLHEHAEQLTFSLKHRLKIEGSSSIVFIPFCKRPKEAKVRELLDDPRVWAVVDMHNEKNRRLRAKILTRHTPDAEEKPYEISGLPLDSDKLAKDIASVLLEPFKNRADEWDRTVLTDPNLVLARSREADRVIEELAEVASLPPLAQNCELKLWRGDSLLFGARFDEAEPYYRDVAGCADAAGDLQERALFRIGLLNNKRADIEKNSGLREAYQNAAIGAFDLVILESLKPGATKAGVEHLKRPALARLAALSLQLPPSSVSTARWQAVQEYFRAVAGSSRLPTDRLDAPLAMTMALVADRARDTARGEELREASSRATKEAAKAALTQQLNAAYAQGRDEQRGNSAIDRQMLQGTMQAQHDALHGELSREKTRVTALGKQVGQLKSEGAQAKSDNARLNGDIARLEETNRRTSTDNARLDADNTRLQDDNARLRDEHIQFEGERARDKAEIARLMTERDTALTGKLVAEAEARRLKNQMIRDRAAKTKRNASRTGTLGAATPRHDQHFLCQRTLTSDRQHYSFAECFPTMLR